MKAGGKHYEYLSICENFTLLSRYVDTNQIEEAYKIANKYGNQLARELTLYFLKEHNEVFHTNPLESLHYVPENYLYEAIDENLCVYVHDGIEEIWDWAFAFCKIKKVIISNKVKYIGDGALSLNAGEIVYKGSKQEFINKFLGKSKCFMRSNRKQTICCTDGVLEIDK